MFFFLFLKAEFTDQATLAWPVDLFFRFDPLVLAVNLLSFGPLVTELLWSLIFVALTLILGRFFCGWVCPLGTTLDGTRRLLFTAVPTAGWRPAGAGSNTTCSPPCWSGSLFSVNLLGLFDPLSLLYRTLAIVLYPAFGYGVEHASLALYQAWGRPSLT